MPAYKPRFTPEEEARYQEVCANRIRRERRPATDKADLELEDLRILKTVEVYTRQYRENMPYEERRRLRNSLSRLSKRGLAVNTGTKQYPKWLRTSAGNALLASKDL